MAYPQITEGRFPKGSFNRYASQARVSLAEYIESVGATIRSTPPGELPHLAAAISKMTNDADRSEAILAATFHMEPFKSEDRSALLKQAVDIFIAPPERPGAWRTAARLSACKAIHHGDRYIGPELAASLGHALDQKPNLAVMLDDYAARVENRQIEANLAKAYPYRSTDLMASQAEIAKLGRKDAGTKIKRLRPADYSYKGSTKNGDPENMSGRGSDARKELSGRSRDDRTR